MKNKIIALLLLALATNLYSQNSTQTLIGETLDPQATANHNQRKIVRDTGDNIFVVYTDIMENESVIKGVKYESSSGLWNNGTVLFPGKNATLAIGEDAVIHLNYESNDSITRIIHSTSDDFINWSTPLCLSDTMLKSTLPVSDIDSSGRLNVLLIEKNGVSRHSLVYAGLVNEQISQRSVVATKNEINDIAIANHLQYGNDELFFGIQYNADSVLFLRSKDDIFSYDTICQAVGNQPCITYNSSINVFRQEENEAKFLYTDKSGTLKEIQYNPKWNVCSEPETLNTHVDYICIDDLAPPIGYSYLFMKKGNLYHGFSYGLSYWGWSGILDTISTDPFNPSIAYKSFNFHQTDYIWMEDAGTKYNIHHKRDPKHIWLGINDLKKEKGFSITGYPNPFSEKMTIKVTTDDPASIPRVKIYNSTSRLINILQADNFQSGSFEYSWHGLNSNGNVVESGIYIIACTVENRTTTRRVVFVGK